MSIASEIERIKTNIANAYTACDMKGAILPEVLNSDNLATSISSIGTNEEKYRTMTVLIDTTNSNPNTCCSYADDAVNMSVGSSEWDTFFGHKPCLFKNGEVVKYLNPNDYTKDVDGNDVDITSGDAGDVMIEFPLRGIIIKYDDTNTLRVSITDDVNNSMASYLAHTRGSTIKQNFYLGAYLGVSANSKLRSISGGTITTSGVKFTTFRTLAQANRGGTSQGYDLMTYYQNLYIQAMYILKYKNLNSQSTIGNGVSSNSAASTKTGTLDKNGMDYGSTTNASTKAKLFGIEDIWGNYWRVMEGVLIKNKQLLLGTDNFNDSGTGYNNYGELNLVSTQEYITKVKGDNNFGFTIASSGGSSTTYFCDIGQMNESTGTYRLRYGGRWTHNTMCGIFMYGIVAISEATDQTDIDAVRLMYL